jgi:uncharacterized protein (TIGR00369 family)
MSLSKNALEELWRGNRSPSPIGKTLGFELVEYEEGGAFFSMLVNQNHWSLIDTVQGGVLTAIAEAAIGVAFATTLAEGETFTITELHIHYLRAVKQGRVDARAKVIDRRRRLGLVECELRDEKDQLLAKIASTCIAMRPRSGTAELDKGE